MSEVRKSVKVGAVAVAIVVGLAGPAFAQRKNPARDAYVSCRSNGGTMKSCCADAGGTYTDRTYRDDYGRWRRVETCSVGGTSFENDTPAQGVARASYR